jgi:hypothetical protein
MVLWSALTALSGLGCGQDAASAQQGSVAVVLSAEAQGKVDQALAAYENVRAKLAKDDVTGIVADAGNLERASNEAAALATGSGQSVLKALSAAAKALKDINKSDADEVRKSFGEVSRRVVALIAAVPSLQRGRFVFSCPMAQGYQKWVQTKSQVDNPYMGTHMLTCGSANDWS